MTRMLNVIETRWNFYECVEAGDLENASAYFETLFHHYQNRGKRIKSLSNSANAKTNKDSDIKRNNKVRGEGWWFVKIVGKD